MRKDLVFIEKNAAVGMSWENAFKPVIAARIETTERDIHPFNDGQYHKCGWKPESASDNQEIKVRGRPRNFVFFDDFADFSINGGNMANTENKNILSKAGKVLASDDASPEEKSVAASVLSKSDDEISVAAAVKVLAKALRRDKDFYFAYQSNIAMAFIDEGSAISHPEVLSEVANKAAKRFLDLFISESE